MFVSTKKFRQSVVSTKCLSTKCRVDEKISTKCLSTKCCVDEVSCRRKVFDNNLSTKYLSTKFCRPTTYLPSITLYICIFVCTYMPKNKISTMKALSSSDSHRLDFEFLKIFITIKIAFQKSNYIF